MQIGQPMLPLEHCLFKFGSWMGGDRDGNPFVTAETTRDVVISARLAAVNAFFNAIEQLMFELSIWRCNSEMQVGGCTWWAMSSWGSEEMDANHVSPAESVFRVLQFLVWVSRAISCSAFFKRRSCQVLLEGMGTNPCRAACAPGQALAEAVHAKQAPNEAVLAEERKKKNYVEFWAVISLKDPFRLVLSEMRDRLFHTREILHHCLVHPKCALISPRRHLTTRRQTSRPATLPNKRLVSLLLLGRVAIISLPVGSTALPMMWRHACMLLLQQVSPTQLLLRWYPLRMHTIRSIKGLTAWYTPAWQPQCAGGAGA